MYSNTGYSTTAYLIAGAGSQMYAEISGIVHLCEHCAIVHVGGHTEQIVMSGETDFHYCLLKFFFLNPYKKYEMNPLINDILDGKYITNETLETARNEVLIECGHRKSRDILLEKVATFVTDEAISAMPTGRISKMQKVSLEDAKKSNPFGSESPVLYLNFDKSIVTSQLWIGNRIFRPDRKILDVKKLFICDAYSGLRVYFVIPRMKSVRNLIMRSIIELILQFELKMPPYMRLNSIEHKYYLQEYAHLFLEFSIARTLTINKIVKAVELIRCFKIVENYLTKAKNMILSNIQPKQTARTIVEDLKCNLVYGTPILYDIDKRELANLTKDIQYHEVVAYFDELLVNIHVVCNRSCIDVPSIDSIDCVIYDMK